MDRHPAYPLRWYIGLDDTDDLDSAFGTGRLARGLESLLPAGCRLRGVVRQQLLVDPRIPYTSHNSAACLVVDAGEGVQEKTLCSLAVGHIQTQSASGSDPGLCIARADEDAVSRLTAFGLACTRRVVTQDEARSAAGRTYLEGHGGTGDGIIGAAAAVGLTAGGWSGRLIEYGRLRETPEWTTVASLEAQGMRVVSLGREAAVPGPEDLVWTKSWLRPRLWAGAVVVPVLPLGPGRWAMLGRRKRRQANPGEKGRAGSSEARPEQKEEGSHGRKDLLSGAPQGR